jgi:hypothetical protein
LTSELDRGESNKKDKFKTKMFPIVLWDEACMVASGVGVGEEKPSIYPVRLNLGVGEAELKKMC